MGNTYLICRLTCVCSILKSEGIGLYKYTVLEALLGFQLNNILLFSYKSIEYLSPFLPPILSVSLSSPPTLLLFSGLPFFPPSLLSSFSFHFKEEYLKQQFSFSASLEKNKNQCEIFKCLHL